MSKENNQALFFRNTIELTTTEGILVESESLWELKTNEFVLVDDDQFATMPANSLHFKKVDN
ncbi:hypothetical protein ACFFVB_18540 [Formosa undariae]|uniref:Uncharacterized protein n=1 Tax=Formosa undariae TaxID=1325436 RepID=A0ABV5F6K8_9FLAO